MRYRETKKGHQKSREKDTQKVIDINREKKKNRQNEEKMERQWERGREKRELGVKQEKKREKEKIILKNRKFFLFFIFHFT